MDNFSNQESLIRRRINENLLKVEDESSQVKSLLSLAVESSHISKYGSFLEPNNICKEIYKLCRHTKRNDLLRACVILGTSRNKLARKNLIKPIRSQLGTIRKKDYITIAELIYLKDNETVEKVNKFLCKNLDGYSYWHDQLYQTYYGI